AVSSTRSASGLTSMALSARAGPACASRRQAAMATRPSARTATAVARLTPAPPLGDIAIPCAVTSEPHVILQQRKQEMVLPDAIDLQVAPRRAFPAEAGLFENPRGGTVVGQAGRLEPMQAERAESKGKNRLDGIGHVAVAGVRRTNPVADRSGLGDATANRTDAEAAEQGRVPVPEDEEGVTLILP